MRARRSLKSLLAIIATALSGGTISGCSNHQDTSPVVHESRYHTPFPLQQGGEQIDVLVRVRDDKRKHQFNLVFVEERKWSEERKDHLWRISQGGKITEPEITPYPVKLRIRIDSVDVAENTHIDETITDRSPLYFRFTKDDTAILRAQNIYARALKPGIYRVRVDNLAPVPQIDFQTLFEFERDNRKY